MMSTMKPRLDHYLGRHVDRVEKYGDEDHEWRVVLIGDISIKNHDSELDTLPEKIVGMTFMTITMGELDTELHFGTNDAGGGTIHEKLTLNATKYTLSDPRLVTEEEYYPQGDPDNIGSGLPEDEADRAARLSRESQEFMEATDEEAKPKKKGQSKRSK